MDTQNLIKLNRMRLGLTREQLAEMVGVSPETIKRWESGAIPRNVQHSLKMQQIFGIPGFAETLCDSESSNLRLK